MAWVRAVAEVDSFRPARYCVITVRMKRQTVITRKRRGPPPTGKGLLIGVRVQPDLLEPLDDWIQRQREPRSRPEAIRRLVEIGLSALVKPKPTTDNARRAASIAAEKHAMDHLDKALKGETDSVRASRKKQLTSMPGGFKRR